MVYMQNLLKHFRHWFVPHESNNHRPRILHHQILFLFILFFLTSGLLLVPVKHTYPKVLGVSYSISTADLLTLTNQQRAANGVAPLVMNDLLTNAAQMKAQNMFADNYWAHFAPDGTSPWYWFLKAGYQYNYAGENLARGFTTANDVVTAWMNSPEHRANMLSSNYNDVGFAVQEGSLTGEDTVLVVQEFGSRNSTNEVAAVSAPQTAQPTPIASGTNPSVTVAPTISVITPTLAPTTRPLVISQKTIQKASPEVAAAQQSPLVNSSSFSKVVVFIVVFLLLIALVIDIVIMRRKNMVRLVAHNVDHIIFFIMILLIIIFIIGRNLTL